MFMKDGRYVLVYMYALKVYLKGHEKPIKLDSEIWNAI